MARFGAEHDRLGLLPRARGRLGLLQIASPNKTVFGL